MKRKSYLKWSWVFMIIFIGLSVLDIRFGCWGLSVTTVPFTKPFAVRGNTLFHYCPRGSLLGNFLRIFHWGTTYRPI